MMAKSLNQLGILSIITVKMSIIVMRKVLRWLMLIRNGTCWKTKSCLRREMPRPLNR